MQLSPATLEELTRLIQQWTGLALGPDKAYLLRHRLAPVVRSCGFDGFDELVLRLNAVGGRASQLRDAVIDAITTKETSFFRDPWLFDAIGQQILPELARRAGRNGIRICSAGTSTGQEAYTLAIVVREFLISARGGLRDDAVKIVALDISGEAIDAARTGLYSRQELDRGLTQPRLGRFFEPRGLNAWQARDSLQGLIQFRTFNLLRNPAELGEFDLILCRNVLIYFDEPTRASVCRDLCSALTEGGWLAVGSAESLYGTGVVLDPVKFGRAFVYRKPAKVPASAV